MKAKDIIRAVAQELGVRQRDIVGPSQKRKHFEARAIAVKQLAKWTGAVHEDLCLEFNRDRSTISYTLRRLDQLLKWDHSLRLKNNKVEKRLACLYLAQKVG